MRKALIGLMLAATVMTPVAAEARGGREHRGGDRGEERSTRVQQQHQRGQQPREVQQDAPAPQPQAQQQPQQQPQPQTQQVVQRRGGGGSNDGNGPGNRGDRGDRGGDRNGRNTQPSIYPQAWQGNPNDPRLRHYQELERRNQQNGARRGDRRDDRRDWRNDRRDDRRDTRNNRNWRNDWNRGWRNDRRYDWNNWRGRNRNIFHISPYYSPYRDWRYQRFSIGFFLEPLFFDQRYWIGDPWQYRLPPAPYGTQWVRYYDDVLLVDIYTGEVVDTIYDFFW
jgi:hypothetical protein